MSQLPDHVYKTMWETFKKIFRDRRDDDALEWMGAIEGIILANIESNHEAPAQARFEGFEDV